MDGHGDYYYRCGLHVKVRCRCVHDEKIVTTEPCPEKDCVYEVTQKVKS